MNQRNLSADLTASTDSPLVVGLGGTRRHGSSSERALAASLRAAEAAGARTIHFSAIDLDLPMYSPELAEDDGEQGHRFVEAIRRCDGLIISSPGYHGGMSGLIKNAIDYIEELRDDERVYLDGRAVGLIVSAYGWQATTTTLMGLRAVVHSLRGWPTPLGVTINSSQPVFDGDQVIDEAVARNLDIVGCQVVDFARRSAPALR
jgi:FMN reductase